MPRSRRPDSADADGVLDYRHPEAKRKNVPPAGLAGSGAVAREPRLQYGYDPHLPPSLCFDETGGSAVARESIVGWFAVAA